jgi:ribosome-binding protein aMBF1 (putative translation factor)
MSDQMKRIFDELRADYTPEQSQEAEWGRRAAYLQAQLIDLAIQIRKAREAAGMTQQQLSELTGITQAQISRIEKARVVAEVGTIFRIGQALKTSLVIRYFDGLEKLAS